jgi:hypothetical protein
LGSPFGCFGTFFDGCLGHCAEVVVDSPTTSATVPTSLSTAVMSALLQAYRRIILDKQELR